MEIVKNSIDLENGKLIFDDKEVYVIIDNDNNPWFKGKDMCNIFEFEDSKKAIKRHVVDEDKDTLECLERGSTKRPPLWNEQPHTIFINESGLYSLILSSKLPKAKEFKRWVTKDVLPSIRKNGEYKIKNYYENKLNKIDQLRLEVEKNNQHLRDDMQDLKDQNNDLKLQITKTSEEHKNDITELKSYYREQRKELKEEFKEQKKELKEQTLQLKESIKDLENKLKIKAVINPSKIRKTHKLIILQHKINSTFFKVLRIQKEREKQEINKYYDKYNIFYNQFEPNPISCFNYLKEHLKRMKYIKNDYNDIELIDLDNYTIEDFKQDLDNLNIIRCF